MEGAALQTVSESAPLHPNTTNEVTNMKEITSSNMVVFLHFRKKWVLEDNGERDEGCVPIMGFVAELADKQIGTLCGTVDNKCFVEIAKQFPGRPVHGWYDKEDKVMCGMIHIKCEEEEAQAISSLAGNTGGSLRPNGHSQWPGFYEFEIE